MEINIWHPGADGSLHHYVQVTEGDIRTYYTDGKFVVKAKLNSDGVVREFLENGVS